MEKNSSLFKHGSLKKISSLDSFKLLMSGERSDSQSRHNSFADLEELAENGMSSNDQNLDQVSEDIDRFIDVLSNSKDKSNPLDDVPDAVETFSKIIESRIKKYRSGDAGNSFGKNTEEDAFFLQGVRRISKLTNALSEFSSSSSASSLLNRTSLVLQRAVTFLEEEFRILLEDSRKNFQSNVKRSSSFSLTHGDNNYQVDRCAWQEPESSKENDFPGYSPQVIRKLNQIATAMISAGYETESCQVYSILRRNAFSEQMKKLEFEKINMEDVHRMQWESLEGEISRWIKVVKACSNSLFPAERQLSEAVFSDHPLISRSLFSVLGRAVVFQLLDFAEAVSITKRSAEKLFKFLDVYETVREIIPAISESEHDHGCQREPESEIFAVGQRLGEAAVNIFKDLETSIRTDASRTPVPGGAVHPLTRYVLNYLKYACEYKETLEHIFEERAQVTGSPSLANQKSNVGSENEIAINHGTEEARTTPFSIQLVKIMDHLDANLESKSLLYKDPSLSYIFLMNNGRYILQKVKGSNEIHQVMGDNWCRRRSTIVRQFHKNYQRETWGKLLHTLSHDGLQVNGKVSKQLLKERFKAFSSMFDEIHRMQSSWVVSDEQLQSELRVSITAVVIPAYRSFLGRFRHYLDNSKQVEKYIKYQPEDIETLIEGLFDGNHASMARRR